MPFKKIILLAGEWDTTAVVYNFLSSHYQVERVIIEAPVQRKEFLKKRIRKLGWFRVAGQVLFQLIIGKPLKKYSSKRIAGIFRKYELNDHAIPEEVQNRVPSVNSKECRDTLTDINPDLVIVHGTRIISQKILETIPATFINVHAGITPRYRGSHGAYWAIANGDKENCGVTVHLVDKGIDTGNILGQAIIPYDKKDNFATYPYLQLAEGLILLKKIVDDFDSREKNVVSRTADSGLWHHPTLWGYIWKRITKGVK